MARDVLTCGNPRDLSSAHGADSEIRNRPSFSFSSIPRLWQVSYSHLINLINAQFRRLTYGSYITFSFSVTQTVQYDSSLSCGVITQTVILCALAGLSFRSYATWLPNTQKLTCKYSKGTLPTARLGFYH